MKKLNLFLSSDRLDKSLDWNNSENFSETIYSTNTVLIVKGIHERVAWASLLLKLQKKQDKKTWIV